MTTQSPGRSDGSASSSTDGRSFSTSYTVDQSPEEVFAAIVNVGAWWTGTVDGRADEVGAEFTYRHPPQHYSRQRVVELEPGRRMAWRVIESDLSFLSQPDEWAGTEIQFDLTPSARGTEVRFTHLGLVPAIECFDACSTGWTHYVSGSLRNWITNGEPLPDPW